MRRVVAVAALLGLLCATGCVRVRPWERDVLARRDMAWEPAPLESAYRGHVHFARRERSWAEAAVAAAAAATRAARAAHAARGGDP